jgi:hypothetical protein
MTRRGMMMLEAIVAGTLLGALLVVCLQLLSAAAAQRHAADQRQCATQMLANVMEQLAARPWDELTSGTVARENISVGDQLPGAELKMEVVAESKEPGAKRITATIRWQDRSGRLVAPLKLTTWKYKIVD